MATISSYFVLNGFISASMKAASGFVTLHVVIGLAIGLAGMLIGSLLGKLTRNKINSSAMKKAVYGVMACSGLINIVTSIL